MPVPNCPYCGNGHSPDVRCRLFVDGCIYLLERLEQSLQHEQDEDCAVDPETQICTVCHVDHSDTCPDCNGRGFHKPTCYWMSPAMLGMEATI